MDTHFDAKHTFKLGENKAWMRNNSSQILKKKKKHTHYREYQELYK